MPHQKRGPLLRAQGAERFLDPAADLAGVDEVVGCGAAALAGQVLQPVLRFRRFPMRPGAHVIDGAVEADGQGRSTRAAGAGVAAALPGEAASEPAAVRNRRREDLNADIQEGHFSAALCHLANMSYRLGSQVPFEQGTKALAGNQAGLDALARMEEHLAKEHNIKLDVEKLTVGRHLKIDASSESIYGDAEANKLLTRNYRKPFNVPEKVV